MSLFVCVYVCVREEGEERGHEVLKSMGESACGRRSVLF